MELSTTNHAYTVLHEAIDAYNAQKLQETIPQFKQQNIRYEYKTDLKRIVIYVTADEFNSLTIDNVSRYGLDASVANGLTVDSVF